MSDDAPVRLVPATSAEEWDALVRGLPGGTAFHDWAWLTLQSAVFGWRFDPLVAVTDGGAIGIVPVLRAGRLHGVRPPFPYVGPVVPRELAAATVSALRRWQMHHAAPVLHLEFAPWSGAHAHDLAGCETRTDLTFVVPVAGRPDDELARAMSPRRRRALALAADRGVAVRRPEPGEVSAILAVLQAEAWAARGLAAPYPASLGGALEGWLRDRSDVFASVVTVRGELAGLQVALTGHDVVLAWSGGALRAHRADDAFTVLAADLLRVARDAGHLAVDLVGQVDEGVSAFKRSLGGVPQPYLTAVSRRLPSVAHRVAQTLERLPRHAVPVNR